MMNCVYNIYIDLLLLYLFNFLNYIKTCGSLELNTIFKSQIKYTKQKYILIWKFVKAIYKSIIHRPHYT